MRRLIGLVAAAALLSSGAPAGAEQTDRTIAVKRGARLDLRLFAGEVIVKVGSEDTVRVHATHAARDTVDVEASDTVVRIRNRSVRGPGYSVDVELTVPAWMPLNLTGTYLDVTIEDVKASVNVETVNGEVKVRGGGDFVSLKSIGGPVTLEGARGRVHVASSNDDVKLSNIVGDVSVETLDGAVTMTAIDSSHVDASTVNGDILFDSAVRDDGVYRFASHTGDVQLGIPERSNVITYVRTYEGGFSTNLPGKTTETRPNRRFTFALGSGSARIDVESFSGDIRLRRQSEAKAKAKVTETKRRSSGGAVRRETR
jgi:hypothetical protein